MDALWKGLCPGINKNIEFIVQNLLQETPLQVGQCATKGAMGTRKAGHAAVENS